MKRSTFIYYSLIGTAAVVVPSLRCSNNHNYLQILRQPKFLSHICDAATLHYIGNGYRDNFPLYSKEQLVNKLMKASNGKTISKNTGDSSITSFLDKKIKADFESGRIVVIKGWILAETEAQQCALFSLS
ncbi:MAG TPA: hypothetical protein VMU83_23835 [Hanamia sp.]|nr:hypothetical protein [Hanamia sp.]